MSASDERGSIISVTDTTGALLAINRYDEFGQPQATNLGAFGYTGQAWLSEVGLWYYKARVYDPELGRFLQTDPIAYGGGPNIYAYVRNDPINLTDPLGLATNVAVILPDDDLLDEIVVTGQREIVVTGTRPTPTNSFPATGASYGGTGGTGGGGGGGGAGATPSGPTTEEEIVVTAPKLPKPPPPRPNRPPITSSPTTPPALLFMAAGSPSGRQRPSRRRSACAAGIVGGGMAGILGMAEATAAAGEVAAGGLAAAGTGAIIIGGIVVVVVVGTAILVYTYDQRNNNATANAIKRNTNIGCKE